MKKKYLILLIVLFSIEIQSQQLNIQETLNYIETLYNEANDNKSVLRDGKYVNQKNTYEINNDGIFIKKSYLTGTINRVNYNGDLGYTTKVHLNDLNPEISAYNSKGRTIIEVSCKYQNCISYQFQNSKKNYRNELRFFVTQEYSAKKLFKAIKYLLSLSELENFNRDKNDPFANLKAKYENKPEIINLKDNNETYSLSINISGILNDFILDTGASETTISSTLEKKLISNGVIEKDLYLTDGLYRIADGSVITQSRVKLNDVRVGNLIVDNLIVSIGNSNSPFLLGRNFLDKFNNWSIDNDKKILKLNNNIGEKTEDGKNYVKWLQEENSNNQKRQIYNLNGILEEEAYFVFEKGNIHKKITEFHANGNKKRQYNLDVLGRVFGDYKSYFENGIISVSGYSKEDYRIGEWKWFKENGELKSKAKYRIGIEKYSNGIKKATGGEFFFIDENIWLKYGEWKQFDKEGIYKSSKEYEAGIEINK